MAVYTQVTESALASFLSRYAIGKLVSFEGIAEGVENSNYRITTDQSLYILTIYEKRVNVEELPFFLRLKEHLASRSFPCPVPIADRGGEVLHQIEGRPAALVSFLDGKSTKKIQNHHVQLLGRAMAMMHVDAGDFPMSRCNTMGISHWHGLFAPLASKADDVRPGLGKAIEEELTRLTRAWPSDLPKGIIHADMFPDNVFFTDNHLSGVIDFYFACKDFLAYDLAIALNAWCFEAHNEFNITKARLLLSAYNDIRPLSDAELASLPILASGAAMRFLLTRLHDWLNPVEGAVVRPKNPLEYWERLCFHKGLTRAAAYGV
jgi:homoserine kinase type II